TRRINRAKSYRKLAEASATATSTRPAPAAAERALLASAVEAARSLMTATGVEALAAPSHVQQAKLFAHQLAAGHRLLMGLSGRAVAVAAAAPDRLDRPEALRLAHGAARLMECFQQGVATLHRMRTSPDHPRPTATYWSGPLGDYDREQEREQDIAAGIDPDTGLM